MTNKHNLKNVPAHLQPRICNSAAKLHLRSRSEVRFSGVWGLYKLRVLFKNGEELERDCNLT